MQYTTDISQIGGESIECVFYPWRRHRFILPLFVTFGVLSLAVGGLSLADGAIGLGVFLIGFAAFMLTYAKITYDAAQQAIYCTSRGMILLNDRKIRLDYVNWDEIVCRAWVKYYRGHPFCVLSRNQLDRDHLKRLAAKCAWTTSIHIDGAIVLWDERTKKSEHFFGVIDKHIQVTECR